MADPLNSLEERRRSEPADVEAELARRDEEILRLRDLLIARDMELGALRGRMAMLENRSRRIADAIERVPIPGLAPLAKRLARVLRRRLL